MPQPRQADVRSSEAIEAFRSNLIVYLSQARSALEEVSADLLAQPGVFLPLLGMGLLALIPVAVAKWRARRAAAGAGIPPPQD